MITISYYIVILLYVTTFLLNLLRWRGVEHLISILAVVSNGILLILIFLQSGHIPVFNIFESFLLIIFIMGTLGLFPITVADYWDNVRLWLWLEIIILLLITLFFPREPALTLYDYDYIYIILFHLFRNTALALMLFSTACFTLAKSSVGLTST